MTSPGPLISVVSPVYRAEGMVAVLVQEIIRALTPLTSRFEIILVEDGSPDGSWEEIGRACALDRRVKGIRLSRNFGQHHAVTAGLEYARGEAIVIMDCDLQDDPAHIPTLYRRLRQGCDIVFTRRIARRHPLPKRLTARLYNALFYVVSDHRYHLDVGTMVMFTRRVRDRFLALGEKERLYIQLLKWLGFRQCYVAVPHRKGLRKGSSYTFGHLVRLAFRGWTAHSDRLLRLSIYFGTTLAALAFLAIAYIVVRYFLHGFQPGWPSLAVLILFSTGVILLSIGIVGLYIGKIFEQVKQRPLYIVDEVLNVEDE